MTKNPKRTYNITALQRGLKLLNLFAKPARGPTATQVANLSALPTSTVHRFLVNLESGGFLNSTSHGTFHLGMACFALGQAALGHLDIRHLSLPYLQELNQKTRETIHLTLLHDLSAVYVEKLDSPEPVRIYSRIGAAAPLHCTAVGKVMLAYMPPEAQAPTPAKLDLQRATENTISNLQELQNHLQRVRRNGYPWDLEANEVHMRGLAVHIWHHTGAVNPVS